MMDRDFVLRMLRIRYFHWIPNWVKRNAPLSIAVASILILAIVVWLMGGLDSISGQNLLIPITALYASVLFLKEAFGGQTPIPKIITYGSSSNKASDDAYFEEEDGVGVRCTFNVGNVGSETLGHTQIFYRVFDRRGSLKIPWTECPVTEGRQLEIGVGQLLNNRQVSVPVQVVFEENLNEVYFVELKVPVRGQPLMTARALESVTITEDLLSTGE